MEIQNQTSSVSLNRPPATTASQSPLSSDFETFLLMLTTQMENQDPLNPVESQDFAVQLATFSGVEQQVKTNDLLAGLTDSLGQSGISQLAGLVGMEARVVAPAAFEGAPITLWPEPEPGSETAVLIVKDVFGVERSREVVSLAGGPVDWAGTNSAGTPLPFGNYSFELESIAGGESLGIKPVAHYALIEEARQSSDGVDVVITGGTAVSTDNLTALRKQTDA